MTWLLQAASRESEPRQSRLSGGYWGNHWILDAGIGSVIGPGDDRHSRAWGTVLPGVE
jgi:hypothetical protein